MRAASRTDAHALSTSRVESGPPWPRADGGERFVSRWSWLAVALLVLGAFAGAPGLLLVGTLLLLSSVLRTLWSRYGLRRLHYERELVRDRVVQGEEVELRVSAWNDKPLPLAWLEVDDLMTEGTVVRERPAIRSERPGFSVLRNTWTLGPWERVTKHLHVVADRRGVYRFGPALLPLLDPRTAVRRRDHAGGTAPRRVKEALARLRRFARSSL